MGTKGKLRLTIDIDGIPRELFSIQETKKNDLLLFRKAAEEADFGPYHGELSEQRFSIHPSPSSDGITITQRVTFADGLKADTYAHIKPFDGHLNWPVIVWASQSLDESKYISKPRSDDILVNIGSYNPSFSIPCYVIIVTQCDSGIENSLSHFPLNIRIFKFRAFHICVLTGFVNTVSTHLGCGSALSTFPPRLGGNDLIDSIDGKGWHHAMTPNQVAQYVHFALERLSESLERRVIAWLENEEKLRPDGIPIDRPGVAMTCRLYSKSPLYWPE